MRIHKEGIKIIAWNLLISALLIAMLILIWPNHTWVHVLVYAFMFAFNIWAISFFRVPVRPIPNAMNAVFSAADGRVVAIEDVYEGEYFNEQRRLVSVFMSPLNVHVNWYPFDGQVVYAKYHPGKFMVAYHPKSSELNERTSIVVERADGKSVLMRQIAGLVARRIIYYANKNDQVKAGEEFGIIRFGSRVDFFLPLHATIKVEIGEKVKGMQTIIAEI
jgi:phosphatidylserine decarboxylase